MAVSKVDINGQTVIDLTGDTITAETMLEGTTAHDKAGNAITGNLHVQYYRSGTGEPSDSLGNDGDLYFVLEG